MWKAELPPIWQEGGEWPYLLGTDTQGRDMLSAILYGTRISLVIGLASVVLSLLIGMTVGLVAGFFGGFVDNLLMRIGDIILSIPTILIAILVSTVVRQMLPPTCARSALPPSWCLRSRCPPGCNMRAPCAPRRSSSATRNMCRPPGCIKVPARAHHGAATSCPTR